MKNFLHNLILLAITLAYKGRKEPRLRRWIELESYKEKIIKYAEEKNKDFPKVLLSYLSCALGVPYRFFEYADWTRLVSAFFVCLNKSPQLKLPITSPSTEKSKEEDWSYDGRTWYLYANIIAGHYGWTLEYISQLKVRDALAIIQEILVDEQLDKEFQYGLSELAYPYDARTKKSTFKPLPRPSWMRPRAEPEKIQKTPIPVSMIPMGVVIADGVLPDELLPKEYEKGTQTQSP